jgi:hydroxyacylglutathione hydrolase
LAGYLYDSLEIIKRLPEHVIVYPAHGPGSSCGKNLGPNTYSTIAEEKKQNYALQHEQKESFIKAVTEGLNTPPVYFPLNASINQKGYNSLDSIKITGLKPLQIDDVKQFTHEDVIILDTRPAAVFTSGFILGRLVLA